MKIKQCGICRKKDIEGKSFGDMGEYCKNCIKRIDAHLKGLKMESSQNHSYRKSK